MLYGLNFVDASISSTRTKVLIMIGYKHLFVIQLDWYQNVKYEIIEIACNLGAENKDIL